MTHNIEAIFDKIPTDAYDPADDVLTDTSWPVATDDQSSTGRPIDDIINHPRFMIQASTGLPYTPRSEEQRVHDAIRRDAILAKQDRAMSCQRLRIAINQSRGELDYYDGSAANDNTPMQKAVA